MKIKGTIGTFTPRENMAMSKQCWEIKAVDRVTRGEASLFVFC